MNEAAYSLKEAIRDLPKNVKESVFRRKVATADQQRAAAVFGNLFLHLHPVKVHINTLRPGYTLGLGLISFYLAVILVVSGIFLMFYYVPSTALAYRSMKDLEFVVSFGMVMRNVHRWAAHAMVISVFLHMCRVFYTGAHKSPREFNWVIGVCLLILTLLLSFTGYLLPWDQLAFWAITVGTNIVSYLPWIGDDVRYMILGGNLVEQTALLRFYVLHCVMLPLLMTVLVGVHFWRIRKDGGLSRPSNECVKLEKEENWGDSITQAAEREEVFPKDPNKTYSLMVIVEGESFHVEAGPDDTLLTWPHLILREFLLFLLVFIVILGVSLVFDAPLEEPANPLHSTNPAKAPWYFVGIQELVSYSAFFGGAVIPAALVLGLLFLPYLDRSPIGVGVWFSRYRWFGITVFSMFVLAMVFLILIGQFLRGPNWVLYWPWR